jgi:pimeloyl-ACP methyl ester carboxylesterase
VLDCFGLERALVTGHSLGAYIAARRAPQQPHPGSGLVGVDGGRTHPGRAGVDPDEFMTAFLGPTLERLRMTFPDPGAYLAWWSRHPALAGADIDPEDLAEYAAHDLVGEAPELRSSINPQVVRDDAIDLFGPLDADALTVPTVLLCAPRGMIDDPNPMQPLGLVQAWAAGDPGRRRAIEVPDVNHYTIVLGRHGAEAVASAIVSALPA